MRACLFVTLPLFLAVACGGEAKLDGAAAGAASAGSAGASAGSAGSAGANASAGDPSTGGRCAEPASAVPDAFSFEPPEIGPLGSFVVTIQNRCTQTVWPAWGSTGGLDNSVVDPQIWLPLSPGTDRTVTVYGGVREVAFWGRTRCNFDQHGNGKCETGETSECSAFVCNGSGPPSATVFDLSEGFLNGYNLPMRVDGATCGSHDCVADVHRCVAAHAVQDDCGTTIGCSDLCLGDAAQCCSQIGSGCGSTRSPNNLPDNGDLVITFCP